MPQHVRRRWRAQSGLFGAVLALLPVAALAKGPFDLTEAQERQVTELVGQLSLVEKIGQLTQLPSGAVYDPNHEDFQRDFESISKRIRSGQLGSVLGLHGAEITNRLQHIAVEEGPHGIPLLFGADVIHGYRTVFPTPLAESCTWSPEWAERAARVAAVEASAGGVHWTFAPMVDIARDPRWGRVIEGSGEDPWLGSILAAARVRGFQGKDLAAPDSLMACAKHFAAYGAGEGGRDYNTVDISLHTLHEVYLAPFHAAVNGGVGTLMTAFNEINGIPATGNAQLLNGLLREKWGFDGFVISDYAAIHELVKHGYAADQQAAAVAALNAGVDVAMACDSYGLTLQTALQANQVSESAIDTAVRRVLRAKMALGLFEQPYCDPQREQVSILTEAHRRTAREVAQRSIVLLKNGNAALPLKAGARVALVGPLADAPADMLGAWAIQGRAEDAVTLLAAMRNRMANDALVHAGGCSADSNEQWDPAPALAAARDADVIVAAVGEPRDMSGEAHNRASLDLPGRQRELLEQLKQTGKPLVIVIMSGRPLTLTWESEHADAIVMAWHLGVEAGPAIADVLWGDVNPSGKLTTTLPRSVGQVPLYYNHKNTGRPPSEDEYSSKYLDVPWTPLYVFGHGLSYTTFSYSNLEVNPVEIRTNGSTMVRITVTNAGNRAGEDVVQLYVRDLVASVTRPVRQLRGFERISLEAGESRAVTFSLGPPELAMLDENLKTVVEPGEFEVFVGGSSAATLSGRFRIVADPNDIPAPGRT